jgi:hypothetical protein
MLEPEGIIAESIRFKDQGIGLYQQAVCGLGPDRANSRKHPGREDGTEKIYVPEVLQACRVICLSYDPV